MFDDPKKELQDLEGQLLAAEEEQKTSDLDAEEFERLYDEILEEFGPKSAAAEEPADPEPPVRNFANGYGGVVPREPLPDGDEIIPDDEPLPQEKAGKGLVFLAVAECLAIAGLVVYWVLNFL